jgi:chromosome segregation ATPase
MAELYLRFARQRFQQAVFNTQRMIEGLSGQIAEGEKRLPEVEQSLETMQKSIEDLKTNVPYRSEQEAMEAIGELDRMLNSAHVEIAGIRARLELMFIEEAVAMRGAEARRQMATELRTRAGRYIDLSHSLAVATAEKENIPQNLERWREELQGCRERLATVREQEPKIRDNKVFIYHVE